MTSTRIKLGTRTLNLSNLDKVLYPQAGFTKGEVIDYYARIAPILLPHLKGRALTLKRYPNGVEGQFFYEKRCPSHRPDWVTIAKMPYHEDDLIAHCVVDSQAALVWVANLACLELHTSLARATHPDQPTMMVFDLDPGPPAGVLDSIRIAMELRDLLAELDLQSFPKTSGGKGLHIYVPVNTRTTYDHTKSLSRALAMLLERRFPKQVTANMRKDLRPGRVFIDWSQNDQHKTTASVYSLRARTRPTVSTPVKWEELQTALDSEDPAALAFEAADVLDRIQQHGDLFAPVLKLKQKLPSDTALPG